MVTPDKRTMAPETGFVVSLASPPPGPAADPSSSSDDEKTAHQLKPTTSSSPALLDSSRGWFTMAMGHFVIFATWGFVNAFGNFQTFYVHDLGVGSDSAVAWIGSLQLFLLFGTGILSGRALDAGYFRPVFAAGSLVHLVGMFMLSLSTQYWQILLTHGVCTGVGYGLVFVPTMALVGTYFDRHKALALGLTTVGSATGGAVFSAISAEMLPAAGFPWTVRTMGFLQLALACVCGWALRPHTSPRRQGPLVAWDALRSWPFALALCGGFFLFWSVFLGFYFVGSFGRDVIGVSPGTASNLLLAMNAVGIIGRVPSTFIGARVGPMNVMIAATLSTAVLGYGWIGVHNAAGLWAFTVVYGILGGIDQASWPMILGQFSRDPRTAGTITGMGFFVASVAALTGPPIAGALIQAQGGAFLGVQILSGTSMLLSTTFFSAARVALVGWKGLAKA